MNTIYLDKAKVPAHLRCGYNGAQFKAEIGDTAFIPADAGTWSEGSREIFHGVRLADGATVPLTDTSSAPWDDSRRDQRLTLRPGFAVVRHSIFCGKDMGLTFIMTASDAAPLLQAPAAELTPVERVVLFYTASRKASYNGKDRYEMARDDSRYTWSWPTGLEMPNPFPRRDDWEAGKAALCSRGLLNKAGAITPAGRNQAKAV